MSNDLKNIILDNNRDEVSSNDYALLLKECFPILLLWIGVVLTVFFSILSTHLIVSILFLLIISLLVLFIPSKRLYLVFILLLAAVFQLVIYFHIRYFLVLIGSLSVDIMMTLTMMIFLYVNRMKISKVIDNNKNIYTEEEILITNQHKVNRFKERFSNRSDVQLHKIVDESKLIPEALEAARQLLDERSL